MSICKPYFKFYFVRLKMLKYIKYWFPIQEFLYKSLKTKNWVVCSISVGHSRKEKTVELTVANISNITGQHNTSKQLQFKQ